MEKRKIVALDFNNDGAVKDVVQFEDGSELETKLRPEPIKTAKDVAVDWYLKGLEYELGLINRGKADYKKAYDCYILSLELGNGFAALKLAWFYFYGYAVKRDMLIFKKYLNLAAKLGCSLAIRYLKVWNSYKNQQEMFVRRRFPVQSLS